MEIICIFASANQNFSTSPWVHVGKVPTLQTASDSNDIPGRSTSIRLLVDDASPPANSVVVTDLTRDRDNEAHQVDSRHHLT